MTLASRADFLLMPTNGTPLLVLTLNERLAADWAQEQGFARAQWRYAGPSLRGTSPSMYVVHESFARRHNRARIMAELDMIGVLTPCVPATRLDLAKMRIAALLWGPRPDGSPVTWPEVHAAIEQYAAEERAIRDAVQVHALTVDVRSGADCLACGELDRSEGTDR